MKELIKKIIFFVVYYSGLSTIYRVLTPGRYRIICYHRFDKEFKNSVLSVSLVTLKKQLNYLNKCYQPVTLKALMTDFNISHRSRIALTIDDGDCGLKDAWLIFQQANIKPTLFLAFNLVGQNSYLNHYDLNDLVGRGLNVESHTLSHPHLSELKSERAEVEISLSKKKIQSLIGKTVDYFAYPYGKYQDYTNTNLEQVKKAGYQAAFTIEEGTIRKSDDIWQLRRIVVFDEPMFMFKVRVSGIIDDVINYFQSK